MSIDKEYVPQRSQLEDANFALHCAYSEIDSLRLALEKYEAHMAAMQKDAETYLTPYHGTVANIFKYKDAEWFVSAMLDHLDGPVQREIQAAAKTALEGKKNGI